MNFHGAVVDIPYLAYYAKRSDRNLTNEKPKEA